MLYSERKISSVVALGVKDGSIRKDLHPMKGTLSLVFMATGFFWLLADTGDNFTDHFGLDIDEFTEYSLTLFFNSIRNNQGNGNQ